MGWSDSSKSHTSGWMKLVESRASDRSLRPLIFVAHPDDETLGASAIMMRSPTAMLVYLTDGAPRDPRLRSPDASGSRADYANLRSSELISALQVAGVGRHQIIFLGSVDQEAIFEVVPRALYLVEVLRSVGPDVVITHPYEGGHPDHDAAALVARLAIEILHRENATVPDLLEMASYHAREGSLVTGQFLDETSNPSLLIELHPDELDRKQQMLRSFRSQWRVLQSFALGTEMLRRAPLYDFSLPPHSGKLWYECLGWAMTGSRWRSLASSAMNEMDRVCV